MTEEGICAMTMDELGHMSRKSHTLEAEDRIVARVLQELAAIFGYNGATNLEWNVSNRLLKRIEELEQ